MLTILKDIMQIICQKLHYGVPFFFLPVLICTTSPIKLSGLKLNAFLLLYANDISKGKGQRSGTKPVMTEDFLAMENSELIYR